MYWLLVAALSPSQSFNNIEASVGHASLYLHGLLARENSHQLVTNRLAVVGLGLVEAGNVVYVAGAESLPELHHSLGGQ